MGADNKRKKNSLTIKCCICGAGDCSILAHDWDEDSPYFFCDKHWQLNKDLNCGQIIRDKEKVDDEF